MALELEDAPEQSSEDLDGAIYCGANCRCTGGMMGLGSGGALSAFDLEA